MSVQSCVLLKFCKYQDEKQTYLPLNSNFTGFQPVALSLNSENVCVSDIMMSPRVSVNRKPVCIFLNINKSHEETKTNSMSVRPAFFTSF